MQGTDTVEPAVRVTVEPGPRDTTGREPGRRTSRLRPFPLLPRRLRPTTRPRLLVEVALVVLSYWLYGLVRNGVPTHATAALHRARDLYDVEQRLGLDVELGLNRFFVRHDWLVIGANYYYATLHFAMTIGVLVWLYRRHPARYRAARTVLYLTNAVALLGFYVLPLAPPRFLPSHGYVDTVVAFHTWGSWASGDVASASNQYAAMPSLHVAWAMWCGIAIAVLARRGWVRVLGAAYPVATLVVIVATANHFVLDAVGGALALACGFGVQHLLCGRTVYGGIRPPVDLRRVGGSAPASGHRRRVDRAGGAPDRRLGPGHPHDRHHQHTTHPAQRDRVGR